MRYWASYSGYTRLMQTPNGIKIMDLNPGSVMDGMDMWDVAGGETWVKVSCRGKVGWVEVDKVEKYVEGYPKDCVDVKAIQTGDPNDPEQYVLWNKVKQVNMCGELCVCYLLGIKLEELLEKWQVSDVPFWKSVFGQGMARGTGEAELVKMFSLFGVAAETLQSRIPRYTPKTLDGMIGSIVGVRINSATGRLNGGGVGHWVVVTNTRSERTGYGFVEVYNPFPNRIEVYSYAEFLASARTPFGARKVQESNVA